MKSVAEELDGLLEHSPAKWCGGCKQLLLLVDFHKSKRTKDGRSSQCKTCAIRRSHEWCRKHPDKVRASVEKWRDKNPEKYKALHRQASKEWKARNPEKVASQRRLRTAEGRGKEACRKSYRKHAEKRREEHRDWLRKNPENVKRHNARRIAEITPAYAAGLLSHGCNLKPKDFPPELLALKRAHLKLKRHLKNENIR